VFLAADSLNAGHRTRIEFEFNFENFMPPKYKEFLLRWLNNTAGVAVAAYLVRKGIHYQKPIDLVVASLLLGMLYAFVRPLLIWLSALLVILTLGLFTFVINGLLLYLVGWALNPYFVVDNFWSAFWGALVITIVSFLLNSLTGTNRTRISIHRGTPPPNPPSGGGPVIDV
jgi:putative membrane protein